MLHRTGQVETTFRNAVWNTTALGYVSCCVNYFIVFMLTVQCIFVSNLVEWWQKLSWILTYCSLFFSLNVLKVWITCTVVHVVWCSYPTCHRPSFLSASVHLYLFSSTCFSHFPTTLHPFFLASLSAWLNRTLSVGFFGSVRISTEGFAAAESFIKCLLYHLFYCGVFILTFLFVNYFYNKCLLLANRSFNVFVYQVYTAFNILELLRCIFIWQED